MGRIFRELDSLNRKDNVKALETLRNQGVEFINPAGEALKKWYTDARKVPRQLITAGKLSQGMVNTLENLLNDYRSKQLHTHE